MGGVLMNRIINSFKNYLLDKSNQYIYYKTKYTQLTQENNRLKNELTHLNVIIDKKRSSNAKLTHENDRLKDYVDELNYNIGGFPPGHYHSPINDVDFLKSREDKIWKPEFIEGIEFDEKEQLDLFKSLTKYYPELPFKSTKQEGLRYYFENRMYGRECATILYSMMRKLNPKKIIEIGSGFTSALMMDVNDLFFGKKIKLIFIEPNPERLFSLMSEQDKINNKVIIKIVQDVNLEKFQELEPNDILLVDSSHIVKTGSDVQHILFKILPKLKSGVYIHFHDIFYPFEYPKNWIINNRWSWNEDYFLRAFLMYNNQFKIVLSKNVSGQSLWLKKV